MNKRWADVTDDDPIEPYVVDEDLEIPVVISKHGIKIKKASNYVPPHQRQHKSNPRVDSKK
jgi:hypothetical protein